jgi:hypothetical protein
MKAHPLLGDVHLARQTLDERPASPLSTLGHGLNLEPSAPMNKCIAQSSWPAWSAAGAFLAWLTAAPAASDPTWQNLSSQRGDLPAPPGGSTQQTGAVVADFDGDGVNDFILSFRQKPPALVWYRRVQAGWDQYVIEKDYLTIEAGGAVQDIDGDGDLDVVFGGDWQSSDVWWWENPAPNFDKNTSWKRRLIKTGGKNQHHDQVFGDFLGTGKPQLAFWNQQAATLFLAEIPDDPRGATSWPITPVLTNAKPAGVPYIEGLSAFDVDGDGKLDILACDSWFKHTGGRTFKQVQFAKAGGLIIAGYFKPSKYPQIVVSPGDAGGKVYWYECSGNAENPADWQAHPLLDRDVIHGHSLQLGDVNGDGHLDVFVAEMAKWSEKKTELDNPRATAWLLYGDGQGNFRRTEFSVGQGWHEARLADLDGDGDLDLLNKPYNWDTPRVDVWLNNGTGPRQTAVGASSTTRHDLTPLHDTRRVLVNPHKGWYHHYPDNHINKYEIARDEDLLQFPGMDHVYVRLAWAYLEPREGQFDWPVIDRIIEKWTANGLGIAFRISCRETSADRVEQQFATPRWVMEAGAKGSHILMGKATGPEGPWEPVYDDPVFLAKLERFLAAFAARYDGQPWLRYVDIGSIGDWGEGHAWGGSRRECGFEARKTHVDLYRQYFKRSLLVASDDLVYATPEPAKREELNQYIIAHGISYRDDSILVDGYLQGVSETFTVRSPQYFAAAFQNTPTVFELEHYGHVKRLGNWDGRPGSNVARFGGGKKGPDYFRGALERLHATYIGYHGYAHEWLADNPELTGELLNRCGYWLFPTAVEFPEKAAAGARLPLVLTLENRGVAPPYQPYELRVRLTGEDVEWTQPLARAEKSWRPGPPIIVRQELSLPAHFKPGLYQLAVGLFDSSSGRERPVELALKASARDARRFYRIGELAISASP